MMTTQEVLVGFGIWRLCLTPLLLMAGLGLYCSTRSLERNNEPASHRSRLSVSGVKVWVVLLGALAGSATVCLWLKWQAGPPADLGWTRWPYLDKRWLVATYLSGIAGLIVLPSLVLRTTTQPGMQQTTAASLPWVSVRARAAFGILLGSILFGPPWNTDASTRFIDLHEQIHWSGLQAIAHGHTPFLGAASFNYGPGMQLANYVYLKTTGQFTIPGFRETFGLSLWVTVSVIYAALFAWLRFMPAVVCAVLTLIVSPVALWWWTPEGVLSGGFGWANPLRFVGPLLMALSLYALMRRPRPVVYWGRVRPVSDCCGDFWRIWISRTCWEVSPPLV